MQPGDSPRRSIYIRVARNAIDPLLRAFDFPEPASSVGCRDVTNVPAQALYLLNDKRITELARMWAAKVLATDSLVTDEARLQSMFVAAIGRQASPEELSRTLTLLASTQQETADSAARLAAIHREEAALKTTLSQLLDAARTRLTAARLAGAPRSDSPEKDALTEEQLLESLPAAERQQVVEAQQQLQQQQALAAALVEQTGELALADPRLAGWTEVGRAIVLLKEFIYLR